MRRDFTAGLLAITVIAVATYLAFGGRPWANDYEIGAQVRSANELHSRTPVRIAVLRATVNTPATGTALNRLAKCSPPPWVWVSATTLSETVMPLPP